MKEQNNVIGIYKIINPLNKIYIGKSNNIKKRQMHYKYYNYSSMGVKIKNSIKKYGWEQHMFEIIEECSLENLNEKEIYWIKFYNSTNTKTGLNVGIGGEGGNITEKTKQKMSKTWRNKSKDELKLINEKRSLGNKGKNKPNAGRKTYTEEQKKILGKRTYYLTEDFKNKCRSSILMFDKQENFIQEFISVEEAAKHIGKSGALISNCALGNIKTAGGYIFKYKDFTKIRKRKQ
jgi:group I intron endonuclease